MDERVRRRRPSRDGEEGNPRNSWSGKEQYSSYDGHSLKFSSSRVSNNSLMPNDRAYTGERAYKAGLTEPELRDHGLNYRSTSPGFDVWARTKHDELRDDGPIHSYSRSRSRSRDRGRSKSRSQSWGRGRDRRSRSPSRNRSRNLPRDQTRSRSPLYDSRRESHRWNDKSGSVLSDRICRDFAAGGCRRGTQCRFLHPDGGDGPSENDITDRRKSRPEPGRAAARYGEESEDDNSRSKSRGSNIPCKNLLRGKCQYGAGCRYSHHIASSESSAAKGVGSASYDLDRQNQGSESGKPMCKYFLAGKCNRDNCWFSHDESAAGDQDRRPRDEGVGHSSSVKSREWNSDQERRPRDEGVGHSSSVKSREWNSDQERRPHDEGGGRNSSVKSREWNGPTWDQALSKSDTAKASRWSDPVDANESTAGPSERMDSKWGPDVRTRGSPERKERPSEKSSFHSNQEWNEDDGRDLGAIKSLIPGNSNDIQEFAPISPGLESGKLDDVSISSHPRTTRKEDSSLLLHVETANADGLKEFRSTMKPDYVSRKSPSQNGVGNLDFSRTSVSGDDLFGSRPSNGQSFDLSGSGQVLPASLNVQNHHERHLMETAKTQETQEFGAHQSFFNGPSNGQVAQYFSNPTAASSMQKFINEQAHAHMHASLNPSTNSARMVAPLQSTMHMQPNPMGDLRGLNSDQKSGFSFEQKSHIPFEQFSPMSGDGIEPDDTFDSPKSKLQETPGISELMNQKMLEDPEVKERKTPVISEQKEQQAPAVLDAPNKTINSSAEFEKEKVDLPKESEEARSKGENGSGNKDDKDMRLFKNALVESVKEMLKPTWKLGKMSRDVHKSIVKKVVDKVTGTIQADHIPKTQDKIDQYLSHAKAKISKLVQAYVDRHNKTTES